MKSKWDHKKMLWPFWKTHRKPRKVLFQYISCMRIPFQALLLGNSTALVSRAAVTKNHDLGGLTNKNLPFHSSRD